MFSIKVTLIVEVLLSLTAWNHKELSLTFQSAPDSTLIEIDPASERSIFIVSFVWRILLSGPYSLMVYMITFADAGEVHPYALITVKLYVPAASPEIVVLVPVPVIVVPPGVVVNDHIPVAGKPFKTTLPVRAFRGGWVIVPIAGAPGVGGCVLITTLPEAAEVHPDALVTVKVYVPAGIPDTVELVSVPVLVVPPGVLVNVQVPVAGNPLKTALPVATVQVGCVIVPTVGAVGVDGCILITTLPDAGEVHPEALVTVKVCVPAARPDIVVLVPVPVAVIPPGLLVNVHVPVGGKSFKTTLPVATVQVGWVIAPTAGAVGVNGCALITTLPDVGEVHPEALVTVNVYVPAVSPDIVVLVPVPVLVVPPGVLVNVQVPVDGNPFNVTLPVASVQVGWIVVPTIGVVGVNGCALMTILADAGEIHPDALVTV
jgi:hypothetical protein